MERSQLFDLMGELQLYGMKAAHLGFLLWRFSYAGPWSARRRHHGAGIRKPSHKQT
jgi:hypothetical protein